MSFQIFVGVVRFPSSGCCRRESGARLQSLLLLSDSLSHLDAETGPGDGKCEGRTLSPALDIYFAGISLPAVIVRPVRIGVRIGVGIRIRRRHVNGPPLQPRGILRQPLGFLP